MENKLITHFHLRKNTIYLRLTVNGERSEISTNNQVASALWNKAIQKVKGKDEKTYLINASLNTLLGYCKE